MLIHTHTPDTLSVGLEALGEKTLEHWRWLSERVTHVWARGRKNDGARAQQVEAEIDRWMNEGGGCAW